MEGENKHEDISSPLQHGGNVFDDGWSKETESTLVQTEDAAPGPTDSLQGPTAAQQAEVVGPAQDSADTPLVEPRGLNPTRHDPSTTPGGVPRPIRPSKCPAQSMIAYAIALIPVTQTLTPPLLLRLNRNP